MPTFAFITQLRAYQRFDSHIKVNTFHLATKSLRCVRRRVQREGRKNYICKKKKSETERKLHNQKSQQAVINGPYIFKAPPRPLQPHPAAPAFWSWPCPALAHTAQRAGGDQNKSQVSLWQTFARNATCGAELGDGNLASWQCEGASSKTLNLSHERR